MNKEMTFTTTDLALAVYLVMRKRDLVAVDTVRGDRSSFKFADYPERHAEVMRFFNRKALVEPNSFLDHIKSLKSLVR